MAKTGEKKAFEDLGVDLNLPAIDLPLDIFGERELQSSAQPTPRTMRRAAKEQYKRGMKRERLSDLVPTPPAAGECMHIVSNGRWDYFLFLPLILDWIGTATKVYVSSWTMSRGNVLDMFKFLDEGRIKQLSVLTGTYFLRRESAVAAALIEGLKERGQRYKAFENHAKVLLVANELKGAFWVTEGSANLTSNPRLEQNILINSRELFEFHRAWMEEMLL